jgi:penicillin G amidase
MDPLERQDSRLADGGGAADGAGMGAELGAGLHRHSGVDDEEPVERRRGGRLWLKLAAVGLPVLAVVLAAGFFAGRHWLRTALTESLPVVDGRVTVAGLGGTVTVERDARGVPHLRAGALEDVVFAQGYVTAEDRLWQMDALRRHAAGELAEVLGAGLVEHDRAQRILGLRAAADRAIAVLPADQKHWLEVYAAGVNAAIAAMEAPGGHLPVEFRLLRYEPALWTPRDSLLVGLAMFQDLSTSFPDKLDREALTAKLAPEFVAELYPVGSWRDHPPSQPEVDLTQPQKDIPDVPLDESQSSARHEEMLSPERVRGLMEARKTLAMLGSRNLCAGCAAGSNGWAVAGSRTRSGKPMLSSDMHLRQSVPGIWYEADLEATGSGADGFHVSGVTLPGTPFVIVGHNAHIAWGFTNLAADVQDLYVEQVRGAGDAEEFAGADGAWHPVGHRREVIRVHNGVDVVLDVRSTVHGGVATPLLSGDGDGIYPKEKRAIALRWTIYDPGNVGSPFYGVNAAKDWTGLLAAMSGFGGPSQNMQYADDQGHIGYHAVGKIPVRGMWPAESLAAAQAVVAKAQADASAGGAASGNAGVPAALVGVVPGPQGVWTALSAVPTDGRDARQEWAGYIPFDQLPQVFDPAGGVVATANARVTPEDYPYPVTLEWSDPYRNERIWKVLSAKRGMAPADMLALQTDVYSDLDRVVAERLTYAIDHAASVQGVQQSGKAKRLREAADLMRTWDGRVTADAAAPSIVDAARAALWPMILKPQLSGTQTDGTQAGGTHTTEAQTGGADAWELYEWGEKAYAEEQIIVHQPAHWLPAQTANWNELLTAAVEKGIEDSHAPVELKKWRYGASHPLVVEHPVFEQSPLLQRVLGMRTGTGVVAQSGDGSTVKQVGRTFGPSERLTVEFGNLDDSTLNVVLGESANPASEWFMDQWAAWYGGTTFAMPFSGAAVEAAAKHRLELVPK